MRQTAFPGILVESIKVEKPPFDERGVIQEFVGRAAIKELEPIQRAADFSRESVGEFIERAEKMIGPLEDTHRIHYNLKVRALPIPADANLLSSMSNISERGVSARARVFARAKNPFEPDTITVTEPRKDRKLSSEELGDIYDVTVMVTK